MRKRAVLIIILGVLAGTSAILRADDRADYRRMIEQQKRQQESYINVLPLLEGKRKIEDLFRVTTEGGKLIVKSPLLNPDSGVKLDNRQMRVQVDGFDGYCTLLIQPMGNRSSYFAFSHASYPNLEGITNFNISMQPNYLQIVRNSNSRTGSYTINLTQIQGRAMYGQPDGVALTVYGADNAGHMTANLTISEPDFATLRRNHGREVDEHLRPMMRELKLESLFTVDPMTAWQVFNDEWTGAAGLMERIKALLPRLDADGYQKRQAAQNALVKLGPEAALMIYRMDRKGLSDEQNQQLDALLSKYSFLSREEAQRLAGDVNFLLDCMYSDNPQVRSIAAHHLQQTLKTDVKVDPNDDYNTRVKRVEELRSQLARPAGDPAKP